LKSENNYIYPLSTLINKVYNINISLEANISGLCCDSRNVLAGDCFIALQGAKHNGLAFITDAIKKGAVAVIASSDTFAEDTIAHDSLIIPMIKVPMLDGGLALLAATFYNFPAKNLNMIGITGTNGKTSIAFLLAEILTSLADKTAIIGTLGYGSTKSLEPTMLTTEPVISLHKKIYAIAKQGFRGVAMEISSHGIKQNRIAHIDFNYLIFTNIAPDHLDYHESFTDYCATKLSLFDRKNIVGAIINWNDIEGRKICDIAKNNKYDYILYGTTDYKGMLLENVNYVFAENIDITLDSFKFTLLSSWGRTEISGGYLGMSNVENVLAVIAYLLANGTGLIKVAAVLKKLPVIPGRMQTYIMPNKARVIIDYAHTSDSLEQILSFLKPQCKGNLFCLFGCGGDRDKGRRYGMGRMADLYASHIILTADNPRDESLADINADIMLKMVDKSKIEFIENRADAIIKTLAKSSPNDIIVIIGKGHESYQDQGGKLYYHSDCAVVESLFAN
jgi:UDP-N-acetylmuramoyl-L-alanyl-D-glutamate--2,6-diaminopimelate ligase